MEETAARATVFWLLVTFASSPACNRILRFTSGATPVCGQFGARPALIHVHANKHRFFLILEFMRYCHIIFCVMSHFSIFPVIGRESAQRFESYHCTRKYGLLFVDGKIKKLKLDAD